MTHRGQAGTVALVAVVALLLMVACSLPASAQITAPVIEQAELRLWPEYDDPGLLVIFAGRFAADTTFPLQVAFPIPAGARNVQATYQDAAGTLINRSFELRDGKLIYELPSPAFHVEYYVDRAPSGEQRSIEYGFEAPYAIQTLRVAAQQPARATGFTLTPAAEGSEQGNDALTYHVLNRQEVRAGDEIKLVLSYSKPDTGLTAPQLAVTSAEAPAQSGQSVQESAAPTGARRSAHWLPWLLVGLGVALLASMIVHLVLSQRRRVAAAAILPARPSAIKNAPPANLRPSAPRQANSGQASEFCTKCGSALRPDDRFCAQCGAPRR